ncbi:hypothetical protein CLOM_g22233 [Closterium sp. NIES-68]|nr:hypothetical protein CLOM_g22233 [Closterium sp. NIES-68]
MRTSACSNISRIRLLSVLQEFLRLHLQRNTNKHRQQLNNRHHSEFWLICLLTFCAAATVAAATAAAPLLHLRAKGAVRSSIFSFKLYAS